MAWQMSNLMRASNSVNAVCSDQADILCWLPDPCTQQLQGLNPAVMQPA